MRGPINFILTKRFLNLATRFPISLTPRSERVAVGRDRSRRSERHEGRTLPIPRDGALRRLLGMRGGRLGVASIGPVIPQRPDRC